MFSVCLDDLISQALSPFQSAVATLNSSSTPSISPWQTLTDPPLKFSIVLVLTGALLAVGGSDSSAIHLYKPSSKSWIKVGDLPTKRWQCACTVLSSGEIFVAGGVVKIGGTYGDTNHVDIGTVAFENYVAQHTLMHPSLVRTYSVVLIL